MMGKVRYVTRIMNCLDEQKIFRLSLRPSQFDLYLTRFFVGTTIQARWRFGLVFDRPSRGHVLISKIVDG